MDWWVIAINENLKAHILKIKTMPLILVEINYISQALSNSLSMYLQSTPEQQMKKS